MKNIFGYYFRVNKPFPFSFVISSSFSFISVKPGDELLTFLLFFSRYISLVYKPYLD